VVEVLLRTSVCWVLRDLTVGSSCHALLVITILITGSPTKEHGSFVVGVGISIVFICVLLFVIMVIIIVGTVVAMDNFCLHGLISYFCFSAVQISAFTN